jgi:hypothetical protein
VTGVNLKIYKSGQTYPQSSVINKCTHTLVEKKNKPAVDKCKAITTMSACTTDTQCEWNAAFKKLGSGQVCKTISLSLDITLKDKQYTASECNRKCIEAGYECGQFYLGVTGKAGPG